MTGIHCATCTCDPVAAGATDWRDVATSVGLCPAGADLGAGDPVVEGSSVVTGRQHIDCLIRGHHNGPHEDRIIEPCRECGAWDEHTIWCETAEREHEWWLVLRWLERCTGHRDLTSKPFAHRLLFTMPGPRDEPTYWIEPTRAALAAGDLR